jgi:4-amino-4-deoxy-L-arabinose transferase-like glycosyltransferase
MAMQLIHVLTSLAVAILGIPPVLLLAVAVGMLFVLFWLPGTAPATTVPIIDRRLLVLLSAVVVAAYAAVVIFYAQSNVFTDGLSPNYIITATLWGRGEPIYHAVDSASRYSMLYGPDPYLIQWVFQKILGKGIHVAKLPTALCAIGIFPILFLVLKREANAAIALVACGYCALALAMFNDSSYWARVDPYLPFFVCVGLAGTRMPNPFLGAIVCGIAMGICADVKLHAVLCFLPLLAMLLRDRGPEAAFGALAVGIAVGLVPFFYLPGISIQTYWQWLTLAARHKLFSHETSRVVSFTVMAAVPSAVAALSFAFADPEGFKDWRQSYRFVLAGLVAGVLLTDVAATKEGSGPNHLLPFIPIFAYLLGRLIRDHSLWLSAGWRGRAIDSLVGGYLIAAVLIAFSGQWYWARYLEVKGPAVADAIAEIHAAEIKYAGAPIGMGYPLQEYPTTFYRVNLVFDGQPYLLDGAALMDMAESNIPLPQATLDALKNGEMRVWLVPAGQEPFTLLSWYSSHKRLFSPEFRQIFFDNYQKQEAGKIFDAWVYHPKAG